MARILIVGGGCRGLDLTRALLAQGHVVRVSTRDPGRRSAIEAAGAECWIGTPERLGSLTSGLEGVTIVCWLMARVSERLEDEGPAEGGLADGALAEARALHGARLESFISTTIDTGVRGFVYEASPGALPQEILRAGRDSVARIAGASAIPWALIEAPLEDRAAWLSDALGSIGALLGGAPLRYPRPG